MMNREPTESSNRGAEEAPLAATAGGRAAVWEQLRELVERARKRGIRSLSDRELEQLGRLYRASMTHLALLRAFGGSARRLADLNALLSAAHSVIYGRARRGANAQYLRYHILAIPETLRRTAAYHLLAAALLVLGGIYGYMGAARDPEWALEFVPVGDERSAYASADELRASLLAGRPRPPADPDPERGGGQEEAPSADATSPGASSPDAGESPMSGGDKAAFASWLWRHNTTIAVTAFFAGALACLPTILLLLDNGMLLGVYSHTFQSHGLAYEWWAWILPHGVTELLAVILLSGGGLLVGHTILLPGEKTRIEALRGIRPHAIRLVMAAFPMLLIAALVESFVRQSSLSEPGRYAFAALSAVLWAALIGAGPAPDRVRGRMLATRSRAESALPQPLEDVLKESCREPR
ncbi:MAG: stage II sporulation protein M [Candidatus Schekmanbacteria bacterium]|nr:stage II sporulation protein M [Candidatus Schekmanbacteria bacterium]